MLSLAPQQYVWIMELAGNDQQSPSPSIFEALYAAHCLLGFDDDDDESFLWYGWPTKSIQPYFQPGPLSEIFTITILRHAGSRIWTSAEPAFRLCWMKLCSSDNHYTTAPPVKTLHDSHFSSKFLTFLSIS